MQELTLDWHGPLTWASLLQGGPKESHMAGKAGVYLWLDNLKEPPAITYVGKASGAPDLWTRQWQHYIGLIGGHYQIPEWHRKSRWEMDPVDPAVRAVVFDRSRFGEVVDDGFEYAKHLSLFLASIEANGDFITRAERQLLWEMGPVETTPGTKSEPPHPITLLHKNARWADDERVTAQFRVEQSVL